LAGDCKCRSLPAGKADNVPPNPLDGKADNVPPNPLAGKADNVPPNPLDGKADNVPPNPLAGKADNAPPNPLAEFEGPLRGGRKKGNREGSKGKEGRGKTPHEK